MRARFPGRHGASLPYVVAATLGLACGGVVVDSMAVAAPEERNAQAKLSTQLALLQTDYIIDAKIVELIPVKVRSGQSFSVVASFRLAQPTSRAALQAQVEVLIDGRIAEKLTQSLSSTPQGTEMDPQSQSPAPSAGTAVHTDVPFLVRAPQVRSSTLEYVSMNLALVSRRDERAVASMVIAILPEAEGWAAWASSPLAIATTGLAMAAGALGLILLQRMRRTNAALTSELNVSRFRERSLAWSDTKDPDPEPDEAHPFDLPQALVDHIRSGTVILYVGPHLGEVVGEPSLGQALRRLLRAVRLETGESARLERALSRGEFNLVGDRIARLMSEGELRTELEKIYRPLQSTGRGVRDLPPLYRLLSELPFAAVLTSTVTTAIDEAFAARDPVVVSADRRSLEQVIQSSSFFIMHLWGSLGDPQSSILISADNHSKTRGNTFYGRFMQSLVMSKQILFVGAAPEEIEKFLARMEGPATNRHHAVIPRAMLKGQWSLTADVLRERFDVAITEYVSTPGDADLVAALEALCQRVGKDAPEPIEVNRRLTALHMSNIGPFKELQLELTAGWNVILGDNACGKSTILRAIALGLCGDAPQAAEPGGLLLRSGMDEGSIRLDVGTETYRTALNRELGEVRMTSSGLTPLQHGRWVVLGFPPLRGVSARHAELRGSSAGRTSQPHVGDLLPLLAGGVDSRLDDLKQWIAGLSSTARGSELLDKFFKVLADLTPSQDVSLSRIEFGEGTVYVNTSDGEIPIEQLSQGMSSTIGWVGTLLQRMYEIYPQSAQPETEAALILVDEIDAHLHPAWQRALIGLVEKHFKNVQIIATTHSPLVVSGMTEESVLVARRDPGDRSEIQVVRASDEVDFEGMRADQILTSPLFGLKSTRSEREGALTSRFAELLGVAPEQRSADQQVEFEELKAKVGGWSLEGETASERELQLSEEASNAAWQTDYVSRAEGSDEADARMQQFLEKGERK